MFTIYHLLVSLLFIFAIAAPGLRSDVRITLAIAFATGLVAVWHSGRSDMAGGWSLARSVMVGAVGLLAVAVFVIVWRSLDAADSAGI